MVAMTTRNAILIVLGWARMSVKGEGPEAGLGTEIKPTWKFRLIGGRRVRNLQSQYIN